MKSIRLATVYTDMPLSLIATVENEIRSALGETPVTFLTLSDPSIIEDAIKNGAPSPMAARRLASLYLTAVQEGADIVLNACSSVGDIADAAASLFDKMGVKFLRIDERMAHEAVCSHHRIGILATLKTTLAPTKALVERAAHEEGRQIEIVEALADGLFGVSAQRLSQALTEKATALKDRVDCFVLAQGSMASSESDIQQAIQKPVYSSPRFAARAIAEFAAGAQFLQKG